MAVSETFPTKPKTTGTLGTFAGVFTPSILTILGIILFRRLGYVVGSAGLQGTLMIIAMSSAICVLTSISLSAIATNLKVKGGGDYYLISRTLGVEFGGAIGIVLFLAQSVSIAFYCIGLAEATVQLLPGDGAIPAWLLAVAAVLFLFVFAWLGADWATKLQYVIMAILTAALFSFFTGSFGQWESAKLDTNLPFHDGDFWFVFAVFFPAVTGFTQGVSMSGDLKDPGKSLPTGTFLAVGLSIVVYVAAAVALASSVPRQVLVSDYGAMREASSVGWLIEAGVIAATLSSAMSSFLGAPRIMQSIARDRIFPGLLFFAAGSGAVDNPRRAILLSGAIALITLALGNLNLIAAVVSMFFLISYGLLNFATYSEARAASPSFRPRFKYYHANWSLLGALGCLGAMVAIDAMAGAAAVALIFGIHQYLKRTAGPARWADSQYSYHFQRIRENLLDMADEPEHPRGWRPCILAFCHDPERTEVLLKFSSWIEGGSGLTTAVYIAEGEGTPALQKRDKVEAELKQFIQEHELHMFARAIAAPDFRIGMESLVQSFGVGKIRANVICLSKANQIPSAGEDDNGDTIRYGRELYEALRLQRNVVVLDAEDEEWRRINTTPAEQRHIDVWWWGGRNSRLSLLLAYLMTRNEEWEGASIRVLAPSSEIAKEKTLQRLRQTLEDVRIHATVEAVMNVNLERLVEYSAGSSIVFFPLQFREQDLLGPTMQDVEKLLGLLPIVALVAAEEDIDLQAGPEEGDLVELTAAQDAAQDAEREAEKTSASAEELRQLAREKLAELNKQKIEGKDDDIAAAEKDYHEALTAAQEAERAATAALARAQDAAKTLATLQGKTDSGTPSEGGT